LTTLVELDDLLKSFDRASDEARIWEGVSNFLSIRDINAYIYHNFPTIGATDYGESHSYQQDLKTPQEPSSMVLNSGFEKLLYENARALVMPMYWSDWKALNAFAKSLKGVSIPVYGPRGRNGCFSIEFCNLKSRYRDLDIQTMQWVCQYAHLNFCRLLAKRTPDLPQLTAREVQILTWIALGKSNTDIADILGISFHTVGTYTRRIFVKTNTNNRTSAALFGISTGVINI